MGSPISGLIAEAVLQRLEGLVFAVIAPKFWKRNVDDTFFIIKKDQVKSFHQLLNTTLPGIEFTMEELTNDRLPFLDVLVQKLPSGDFETSVYRKETYADVVLHFDSNHPACNKRGCIKALVGRVDTHCSSEEARRQERTYLDRLFNDNRYPINSLNVPCDNDRFQLPKTPPLRPPNRHGDPSSTSKEYQN